MSLAFAAFGNWTFCTAVVVVITIVGGDGVIAAIDVAAFCPRVQVLNHRHSVYVWEGKKCQQCLCIRFNS